MNALNLFEANIVLWIQENLRVGFLNPVMRLITTLGNGGAFWIVLAVALLIFKKTRKVGLCCALALIFDLLVVNICIKPLVGRVRPYAVLEQIQILVSQPGDHSFPSGHSAGSFACAWAFFRMYRNKKWGIAAVALAALIALSRLYVGVHYPTDVIFGVIIGVAVAEAGVCAGRAVWRRFFPKKKGGKARARRT